MKKVFVLGLLAFVVISMVTIAYAHLYKTTDAPVTATSIIQEVKPLGTSTPIVQQAPEKGSSITSTIRPGMKQYRNEEFGFEFWYPEGWEIKENLSKSPWSEFNLDFISINGKRVIPFNGLNMVTSDFFDGYVSNAHASGFQEEDVSYGSVTGKQFRHIHEEVPLVDVAFRLGNRNFIFGVEEKREEELKNILSSFKYIGE